MKNKVGWLTDSNIVALAIDLNEAVPGVARLEAQAWGNEAMHSAAMTIIRDHAAMRTAIDSVARLKRLPAQAPAVAPSVIAPYDSLVATQAGLPMADRESHLLEMLIAVHERSTVDFGALAGNASDPDLRTLLANRGVMMEQAHASRLQLMQGAIARVDSARQQADSAKRPPRGDRE
jgi:hypothetical protein